MVQAADALRKERGQKQQWPYPWSYPPPGAIRVIAGADTSGTLVTPALATPTQGLLYTVDEGFQFVLTELVVIYINGSTSNQGVPPGGFTWSLTVNQPVGVSSFQGSPIQGFTNVDVPLGSIGYPWPLEMPEFFQPNDQIRSVFTNVALSVGGANWFKTLLLGWKWA